MSSQGGGVRHRSNDSDHDNSSHQSDIVTVSERSSIGSMSIPIVPPGGMKDSEFRAQVKAEEEKVMAEFGLESQISPPSVEGSSSHRSFNIPMIGDIQESFSDEVSLLGGQGSLGNETGTTNTADIYSMQSEWVTKFGGGQMDDGVTKFGGGQMDDGPAVVTPPAKEASLPSGPSLVLPRRSDNYQSPTSEKNIVSPGQHLMAGKWTEAQQQSISQGANESATSLLQGSNIIPESDNSSSSARQTSAATKTLAKGAWIPPPSETSDAAISDAENAAKLDNKATQEDKTHQISEIRTDKQSDDDDDDEKYHSYPVMGISPLAKGGWAVAAAGNPDEARLTKAFGSQSSLAVSESEASSNFDEAANNNFPSSILGSAGTAPAALMATGNWSNTKDPVLYSPRHGNRLARNLQNPYDSNQPQDDYLVDHVDIEGGSGGYHTPERATTPVAKIPSSVSAPTSLLPNQGSLDTDDDYDGDDSETREEACRKTVTEKPYNVSVRGQSSRSKFSTVASPRSRSDDNVSSTSSSARSSARSSTANSADLGAGVASAAVIGLGRGGITSSDDDDGCNRRVLYSVPYDLGNGHPGYGVSGSAANSVNTPEGNAREILAGGRTTSFGSEGFAQIARNRNDVVLSSDDDISANDGRQRSMVTGAVLGTVGLAAGAAAIASSGATDASSMSDSLATRNLPGKHGTGGLYQIAQPEATTRTSLAAIASTPTAVSGAGAGFNVGQVPTNIRGDTHGYLDQEYDDNGNDFDGSNHRRLGSQGDLKPLGMIIVGTGNLGPGGFVDVDVEDVSLLKEAAGEGSDASGSVHQRTEEAAAATASKVPVAAAGATATEPVSIWKQKVFGVQVDRLVLILTIVVLIALAIIVGSVVAQQRNNGGKSENSENANIGEATNPPGSPPAPTTTSKPTRRKPIAQPFISVPFGPTLSPAPTVSPAPTLPCTDSTTAEFFAGVGIGAANCTWLASRPDYIDNLCRYGQDAYDSCPVTCGNCRQIQNASRDTLSPTVSPTISPSGSPLATDQPTTIPTQSPSVPPTKAPVEPPTSEPSLSPIEDTRKPTVTSTPRPSHQTTTAAPSQASTDGSFSSSGIKDVLLTASPSSRSALNDPSSAQSQALAWLEKSFRDGVYKVQGFSEERLINLWALATFAMSLQSEEWMVRTGWLNEPYECDWDGIVCDPDGDVSEINLANNDLKGQLPREITLIKSLTVFDISNNAIQGPLPSNIGDLSNLQVLLMDRNAITGDIPSSIVDLKKLVTWHFERNLDFGGEFPAGLAKVKTIRSLNFYYTSVTGQVPGTMCDFIKELILDCRQVDSTCWTRCFYRCGGSTGISC